MKYLILQHPGHNRVYYNSADKLALAELKMATSRLSGSCRNEGIIEIENIRYLSFETDSSLKQEDLSIISRLSFVFALFTLEEDGSRMLLNPVRAAHYQYLDGKISSLLKYQGKTNELFTKMMINMGLLSSDFSYQDNINLLDPVAGKGTTLFEGTVYGFNSYGIEIDSKSVHDSKIFFKKYLETERIKHKYYKKQIFGSGKANAIILEGFEYSNSKKDYKSGELNKTLSIINGKSQDSYKYFKKKMFHLIIGDLPYGIYHGNQSGAHKTAKTRNPMEFLTSSLPEWIRVLNKGGVIVVAWNSFVTPKHKLDELFTNHGLTVINQGLHNEFEHMVDKSIKRDIIIAKYQET